MDPDDNYAIWVESRPGYTPSAADWWHAGPMRRELAEAVAEACNRVNGTAWTYSARAKGEETLRSRFV